MSWRIVRFTDGGQYGLARFDRAEPAYHLDGGAAWRGDLGAATTKRRALNAGTERPSASEFDRLTAHVTMRPRTADAVRDVVVNGATWRSAAQRHGVTQAGILAALRRIKQCNPDTA